MISWFLELAGLSNSELFAKLTVQSYSEDICVFIIKLVKIDNFDLEFF